uniref:DNA topoisomerase (ATP-hydrolyzing) n=1 Tax=Bionectria ochroleuca TaxID=29856 RepID=A0A0B7K5A4_BIOOC
MPQRRAVVAGSRTFPGAGLAPNPGSLIAQIEGIFESIVESIIRKEELTINFERLCFPGRSQKEATKFTRVLLILQLSHDALVSNEILTKRHIFYQNQELFGTQARVDELVDCLALTLGVGREDLNIVATSKGLVAGQATVHLKDGTSIDASYNRIGSSIPLSTTIASVNTSNIKWILVIEKDAVFRSLVSTEFWRTSAAGLGLLVTGKGYPDLLTWSFLHIVQRNNPNVPILVLVDYDPDGVNILRCYRWGLSRLPSPKYLKAHWIGIKARHVLESRNLQPVQSAPERITHQEQAYSSRGGDSAGDSISSISCREPSAQLSVRDRQLVRGTLRRIQAIITTDESSQEVAEMRYELQKMLMLGVKAEIQWLDDGGNLTGWLEQEIILCLGPE